MDIISILDSILNQQAPDVASMQVFDALTLAKKHDEQLRTLAQYLVDSGALTIDIDASENGTTVLTIGTEQFCSIAVTNSSNGKKVTVTFADRWIWQARAYYKNANNRVITTSVSGKVVALNPVTTPATPIVLQIV